MINENKVKVMTHIATFEEKERKRAMKIEKYDKKDYVSLHVIITWIGASIGFFLLLGIILLSQVSMGIFNMNFMQLAMVAIAIGLTYILFSAIYVKISYGMYSKKYDKAKESMKKYSFYLKRLNRLYDREDLE